MNISRHPSNLFKTSQAYYNLYRGENITFRNWRHHMETLTPDENLHEKHVFLQILEWQLLIKWMTTPCYHIIFLPVFPKQQTFLCHPIQDLRQCYGSKYSDQLIILNAIMYYSSCLHCQITSSLETLFFFFFNRYTLLTQ